MGLYVDLRGDACCTAAARWATRSSGALAHRPASSGDARPLTYSRMERRRVAWSRPSSTFDGGILDIVGDPPRPRRTARATGRCARCSTTRSLRGWAHADLLGDMNAWRKLQGDAALSTKSSTSTTTARGPRPSRRPAPVLALDRVYARGARDPRGRRAHAAAPRAAASDHLPVVAQDGAALARDRRAGLSPVIGGQSPPAGTATLCVASSVGEALKSVCAARQPERKR